VRAQDRRLADAQVQVRRAPLDELAEEGLHLGARGFVDGGDDEGRGTGDGWLWGLFPLPPSRVGACAVAVGMRPVRVRAARARDGGAAGARAVVHARRGRDRHAQLARVGDRAGDERAAAGRVGEGRLLTALELAHRLGRRDLAEEGEDLRPGQ
jgi:hypothetical protein